MFDWKITRDQKIVDLSSAFTDPRPGAIVRPNGVLLGCLRRPEVDLQLF
jgi:hypothetical protein